MKAVFVDTAGWVAAADAADPGNGAVRGFRDRWMEEGGVLVTTDYVCDETLTTLRFRLGLKAAEAWWRQADGSPRVRFEQVDAARQEKARGIFFRYRDHGFSFTHCTSFVVMREVGVRRALTLDEHFRAMGFTTAPGSA